MDELKQESVIEGVIDSKKEEGINLLKETEKINSEMENYIDQIREERIKIEKAIANYLASGRGLAGQKKVEETEEEKWEREAKIRYAGTGLDPTSSRRF